MEITHECEDNTNKEIMNASYVRENGDVIDLNISFIDKQGHSNISSFWRVANCPKEFHDKKILNLRPLI